jgi:diguanylate cyclase (GGDEF)-like protein
MTTCVADEDQLQGLLEELVARPGVEQELRKIGQLGALLSLRHLHLTSDPGDLEDAGIPEGLASEGLTLLPGEASYGAPALAGYLDDPLTATLSALALYVTRVNAELEVSRKDRQQLSDAQQRLTEHNILLRELAVVDELTGLRNRRFFERTIQYEVDRMRRYDRHLSVVMIDVDHFKSINDQHGHPVGDEVLKCVSRFLEQGVRKSDLAARYGGEEFALVLPETPSLGAVQVAERIREAIEGASMSGIRITASFGVATTARGWTGDIPAIVRAADQALYHAKRTGRNKVVSVELDGDTP